MLDSERLRRLNATTLRKNEAMRGSHRLPTTANSPARSLHTMSTSQQSWVNPNMHNYVKPFDVQLNKKLMQSSFYRQKGHYDGHELDSINAAAGMANLLGSHNKTISR